MGVPADVVSAIPATVVLTVVALRWGVVAVLTLFAGLMAVLTRDPERGERALEVLRLLRRPSAGSRRRRVTRK